MGLSHRDGDRKINTNNSKEDEERKKKEENFTQMMGSKQRANSVSKLSMVFYHCLVCSPYDCTMFPIKQFGTCWIQCARAHHRNAQTHEQCILFIFFSNFRRALFSLFSRIAHIFFCFNFFRKLSHGWHDFIPSWATFLSLALALSLSRSLTHTNDSVCHSLILEAITICICVFLLFHLAGTPSDRHRAIASNELLFEPFVSSSLSNSNLFLLRFFIRSSSSSSMVVSSVV